MLDECLVDIPCQITRLRECLESGDVQTAERQAHSIKGAAANVAAEALRVIALEMEQAGTAGQRETMTVMLPRMEQAFAQVRDVMRDEPNSHANQRGIRS